MGSGNRRGARKALRAEGLEARRLLAVWFDGQTLFVTGDGRNQSVEIVDDVEQGAGGPRTLVSFDADGNGAFTDPGDVMLGYANVKGYDIRMGGGNDSVTLRYTGPSQPAQLVYVDLGAGNDKFRMDTGQGGGSTTNLHGPFTLTVAGGDGDDSISAGFDGIFSGGSVELNWDLGRGDDTASLGFGDHVIGPVDGRVLLGEGNDRFGAGFHGEHSSIDAGPVRIDVYGGDGQDTLTGASSTEPGYTRRIAGSLYLGLYGQGGADYISTTFSAWRGNINITTDGSDVPPPVDPYPVRLTGYVDYYRETASQEGFAGITVFVDRNGNGQLDGSEPSARTNDWGWYDLGSYPPGTYTIRLVVPPGWHITRPASGSITVPADGSYVWKDFLLQSTGIQGAVHLAQGMDGAGSVAGSTVYIDANGNGRWDAGEVKVVTGETGTYEFLDLAPGATTVRCIPPGGWAVAGGSQGAQTLNLVSGQISGSYFAIARPTPLQGHVYYDGLAGRQGYGRDRGTQGIVVFLDANENGRLDAGERRMVTDRTGSFTFGQMPLGTYRVGVVVPEGFIQIQRSWMPTTVTVAADSPTRVVDISLIRSGIGGKVWGWDGGGSSGLPGISVLLDLNSNGVRDAGEPVAVTDSNGQYRVSSPPAGTYQVRVLDPDGLWQANGREVQTVTVVPGQAMEEASFYLTYRSVTVGGRIFYDANRNGWQDDRDPWAYPSRPWTGETEWGIPGVTVHLGMQSAVTDAYGRYTFMGVADANAEVRVDVPAGWRLFSRNTRDVALVRESGGYTPGTVQVMGAAFDDVDANGLLAMGEDIGLAGITVYLDANGNGVLDTGERRTKTNAKGLYTFDGIAPGYYLLRVATPDGWLAMAPQAQQIRVGVGESVEAVSFGLQPYPIGSAPPPGARAVQGTSSADEIHVVGVRWGDAVGGVLGLQVIVNGVAGAPLVPAGLLEVYGLGGNDVIIVDEGVRLSMALYGGAGNDSIIGGSGDNLIEGGEGDDTLVGGGGDDTLYAHDGADQVDGGAGDDEVYGNAGSDTLYGGEGNDLVYGQGGDDALYGNAGSDTLDGGEGRDVLKAALGEDSLRGGLGDDSLYGGDGADTILGDAGNDYIEGRGKADRIEGGNGNDTIWGGAGADSIAGGEGNDWVNAGPGEMFVDTVDAGAGADTVVAAMNDVLDGVEVSVIG